MDEWKNEADILEERFYNSIAIIGTQKPLLLCLGQRGNKNCVNPI